VSDLGLLPQPGGFEGFGPVIEVLDSHNPPIPQGTDGVHSSLGLDSAFFASAVKVRPDHHETTGVHELLRLK
jgi:hypothetical protein